MWHGCWIRQIILQSDININHLCEASVILFLTIGNHLLNLIRWVEHYFTTNWKVQVNVTRSLTLVPSRIVSAWQMESLIVEADCRPATNNVAYRLTLKIHAHTYTHTTHTIQGHKNGKYCLEVLITCNLYLSGKLLKFNMERKEHTRVQWASEYVQLHKCI